MAGTAPADLPMHSSLAVVSFLLVALVGCRPLWVVKEFPPDGSTLAQVGAIGVELDLTKADYADLTSLQLIVDGTDVTSQSTITMTRDWPPSFVYISYTPIRLHSGVHRVEVRGRSRDGRTLSHAWNFAISPP